MHIWYNFTFLFPTSSPLFIHLICAFILPSLFAPHLHIKHNMPLLKTHTISFSLLHITSLPPPPQKKSERWMRAIQNIVGRGRHMIRNMVGIIYLKKYHVMQTAGFRRLLSSLWNKGQATHIGGRTHIFAMRSWKPLFCIYHCHNTKEKYHTEEGINVSFIRNQNNLIFVATGFICFFCFKKYLFCHGCPIYHD